VQDAVDSDGDFDEDYEDVDKPRVGASKRKSEPPLTIAAARVDDEVPDAVGGEDDYETVDNVPDAVGGEEDYETVDPRTASITSQSRSSPPLPARPPPRNPVPPVAVAVFTPTKTATVNSDDAHGSEPEGGVDDYEVVDPQSSKVYDEADNEKSPLPAVPARSPRRSVASRPSPQVAHAAASRNRDEDAAEGGSGRAVDDRGEARASPTDNASGAAREKTSSDDDGDDSTRRVSVSALKSALGSKLGAVLGRASPTAPRSAGGRPAVAARGAPDKNEDPVPVSDQESDKVWMIRSDAHKPCCFGRAVSPPVFRLTRVHASCRITSQLATLASCSTVTLTCTTPPPPHTHTHTAAAAATFSKGTSRRGGEPATQGGASQDATGARSCCRRRGW
jgi:hypothetical protein